MPKDMATSGPRENAAVHAATNTHSALAFGSGIRILLDSRQDSATRFSPRLPRALAQHSSRGNTDMDADESSPANHH
jgi:hypothetical protein